MTKLKIMISSPMKGKTDTEIHTERKQIHDILKIMDDNIMIMDTIIPNVDELTELQAFARSVQFLSQADILCMGNGWKEARGCKLEHDIARAYYVPIIYMNDYDYKG